MLKMLALQKRQLFICGQIFLNVETFRVHNNAVKLSMSLLQSYQLNQVAKLVNSNQIFQFGLQFHFSHQRTKIHRVSLYHNDLLIVTQNHLIHFYNVYFAEIIKDIKFEKNASHFDSHSSFVGLNLMHHSKAVGHWRLLACFEFSYFLNLGLPSLVLFVGVMFLHGLCSIKPFNVVRIVNWRVILVDFKPELWNRIFEFFEHNFLNLCGFNFGLNLLIQSQNIGFGGTSGGFFMNNTISFPRELLCLESNGFIRSRIKSFFKVCEVLLNHRDEYSIIILEKFFGIIRAF